ncbi:MAG: LCP family protein [Chloroflexi bacterium]|nr:LCP family protein [Chloroflexota bacterium]MBU1750104.1 LCP family protein [Chloroflexota bacterium]
MDILTPYPPANVPSPSRIPTWAKVLFAVLVVLFFAGGLFLSYEFYTLVRTTVAGLPALPKLTLPSLPQVPLPVIAIGGATPVATGPQLPSWDGTERVNVLLLGVDARERDAGGYTRTDIMMVATIDPVDKTAAVLSIPRDLYVEIPGRGEDRINAAHVYGELDHYPGGGPGLAKDTIELNFGIPIHYYARVDFNGFVDIVETVGGVTVDVEKPVKDDEYPVGNRGMMRIYIPAGLQHMGGETALEYARSRHGDSVIQRARRAQQVLLALRTQALKLDLLPQLPVLVATMRDTVQTDVPLDQRGLALAQLVAEVDASNIDMVVIDESMVMGYVTSSGAEVMLPKWDRIRPVIQELFYTPREPGPPTPIPTPVETESSKRIKAEGARIEIQNGTTRPELLAGTAELLRDLGYNIVATTSAERSDYTETIVIVYTTGKDYTLGQLIGLLNVKSENVRWATNPRSTVDMRVILGHDWSLPNP